MSKHILSVSGERIYFCTASKIRDTRGYISSGAVLVLEFKHHIDQMHVHP
jgi:hypothetical protein